MSEHIELKLMSVIDLTSLNSTDTEESIADFCMQARNALGHVAAVCVYPQFVRLVAAEFAATAIKVATVVNFPEGRSKLENVLLEIEGALEDGAQEIDVVFPYSQYLKGEKDYAKTFVSECKAACGENVTLKVILETGALLDSSIIAAATSDALTAGADFIKTSTGKIAQGATLAAAETMLLQMQRMNFRDKGLKISGGIRETQQAAQYIELASRIMGQDWVTPDHFRIGASQLVGILLKGVR